MIAYNRSWEEENGQIGLWFPKIISLRSDVPSAGRLKPTFIPFEHRDHEKGRRSGRSRAKPFERKHHRTDETGWIKILFESAAQLARDFPEPLPSTE